jgi:hypothetical protein
MRNQQGIGRRMVKLTHWVLLTVILGVSCAYAQTDATSATPAQQMSLSQFQQWVQGNNVALGQAAPISTPTATPSNDKTPTNPPPITYQQNQQTMVNSAPPTSTQPSADATAAFNAMLQQNMPLSPQQVVQLHQQIDMAQRAASIPANIPPKPVSTT